MMTKEQTLDKSQHKRAYYSDSISNFLLTSQEEILGKLASANTFDLGQSQRDAWKEQITILKNTLNGRVGNIYFEYSIPRMGKRIDAVLVIKSVVFVIEFKVGESEFLSSSIDQVWDYALDLKNFHETSHEQFVAPVLLPTRAQPSVLPVVATTHHHDRLLQPILCTTELLSECLASVLEFCDGPKIDPLSWESGRYCPTPTIIEAAMALYSGHSVIDITRSDASAVNLSKTTASISEVVRLSKERSYKSICFVTGVPGAGKTLVGLNIATDHIDKNSDMYSVFLSGNGPLVAILREALARDKVAREKELGNKFRKSEALSDVKMFIQNVHNFRDDCLIDTTKPPVEHVAIFDEAQRAWNLEKTGSFMRTKKKISDFNISEPEYLISCLDRHPDWAVIVCLVGGGQEINTGEAGIGEWIESLKRIFPDWHIHISSRLHDSEYGAGKILSSIKDRPNVFYNDGLHLSVSMRSFRAEHVSALVKQVLDFDIKDAKETYLKIKKNYPIVLTRDLDKAKEWLRSQARGTERYGIIVSSQAQRLKPYAIDVRANVNPINWFLDGKEDVRSSYYLEDVATEFQIQGLELDWACVTWDADFRYTPDGWGHFSFRGDRWNRILKAERKIYLKNAYRVLLTRARQGMVIVVPEGVDSDPTRAKMFYDPTYAYLESVGLQVL
ncbi:hypothetical protein CHISP_2436 [Chitinispirillum alkaliphilum]|nr:hypothetical protein CHISP_2436 [Chitinispirillum alkaliphilum]